jgi:hypothetical protein
MLVTDLVSTSSQLPDCLVVLVQKRYVAVTVAVVRIMISLELNALGQRVSFVSKAQ